jgi:hypothetical protein
MSVSMSRRAVNAGSPLKGSKRPPQNVRRAAETADVQPRQPQQSPGAERWYPRYKCVQPQVTRPAVATGMF